MTTIVKAAWLLTVSGVSVPGVEPSCLGTASNGETDAGIEDDTVDASIVANAVWGAPTTGATLSREMLESMESLNSNQYG